MAMPGTAAKARLLFYQWDLLRKAVQAPLREETDRIFAVIKRSLLNNFLKTAGRNRSVYDEKLYDCCDRLADYYRRALWIYESNALWIETERVVDILDGLSSILNSRIRSFDESREGEEEGQNPIVNEKKTLFGLGASEFIRRFMDIERDFRQRFDGRAVCGESPLRQVIIAEVAEECYAAFREALISTISRINDIHGPNRQKTALFLELLENERDILHSLIKVQAAALEGITEGNDREKQVVAEILALLRDGYQYFLSEASEIPTLFKNGGKQEADCQSFEEWTEELAVSLDQTASPFASDDNFKLRENVFYESMKKGISFIFDRAAGDSGAALTIYGLQRKCSSQIQLTNEVIMLFSEIVQSGRECAERNPQNQTGPENGNEAEIIGGITETVSIKTESLAENNDLFEAECNGLITHYTESVSEMEYDEDVILNACVSIWAEVFSQVEEDDRSIDENFAAFIKTCAESEPFLPYMDAFGKMRAKYADRIGGVTVKYLKEVLLYEISTYEEILNYSVSRLRESDCEAIKDYIEKFDGVTTRMFALLRKNNIEIIEPNPHDPFNGKHHEVLLAETHGDFGKGEIVKCMNSGYIQNDMVLLRANVIAAR